MLAPGANLGFIGYRHAGLGWPAESLGLSLPAHAEFMTTLPKRKSDAFPGRQPSAKFSKLDLDGPVSTPPCNPPGEAFAVSYLREYVDRGSLLTPAVMGLAPNSARKWGLAFELPAGWYVIDDNPGPRQLLTYFDPSSSPPCGWKVTGPQMKVFNPDVPVQIRYGNPKDGCTQDYSAMRAAVYTWCHQDATGVAVEGSVKLIHVYVGRASRNRNAPRRSAGRRAAVTTSVLSAPPAVPQVGQSSTPPDAGLARLVGPVAGPVHANAETQTADKLLEQKRLQFEDQLQRTVLSDVGHRIATQLRAQNMEDAARVAESVVIEMQARLSSPARMHQNLIAAIEEERKEEAYALEVGARLRSRAEVIEMINAEYMRLYKTGPPVYTEDAIAWLLKELQSKCKQTARLMARIVIAYEKKHIEAHDITVKSHSMAAKVLHMLGTGVHMYADEDEEDETNHLPGAAAPLVISQEEKAVAQGIGRQQNNAKAGGPGREDNSRGSSGAGGGSPTGAGGRGDGELQDTTPAAAVSKSPLTGISDTAVDAGDEAAPLEAASRRGRDVREDFEGGDTFEINDPSTRLDIDNGISGLGSNLPDLEEFITEPGPTCFAPLVASRADRNAVCADTERDASWKSSGVARPTKRLPERSANPGVADVERRECSTQLGTLNHIYVQTLQNSPRLRTDEDEIRARYDPLNHYGRQLPGGDQRPSQLMSHPRSDVL